MSNDTKVERKKGEPVGGRTDYERLKKMTEEEIEENAKKRMPSVRDCSQVKPMQVIRQGDIYVVIVDEIEGKGAEIKNRQLVPGISNGSRHVVADSPHVRIFKSRPKDLIAKLEKKLGQRILDIQIGPAIEAETEWTITHPNHPFCSKIPAGKAQIIYQVDPVTKQRAQD